MVSNQPYLPRSSCNFSKPGQKHQCGFGLSTTNPGRVHLHLAPKTEFLKSVYHASSVMGGQRSPS